MNQQVQVMGGRRSTYYAEYKRLCVEAFLVVRRHAPALLSITDMMVHRSMFPAFLFNPRAAKDMKRRFMLDVPDGQVTGKIEAMIDVSYKHAGTTAYDKFQVFSNGIAE